MTRSRGTLVLQSHRRPLPGRWLERCLASVQDWAAQQGYHYRFEDDTLLARLPADLRERTRRQPVIATDLARLAALQAALDEGFDPVVWLDADTLVLCPAALRLPEEPYALGREVWVQVRDGRLRTYVKVHNAFLMFRRGNPFLDFYRHAAERIVRAHQGTMVPQLVGPKLLSALHNLIGCPVVEEAAMLSPAVAADVLAGGGPALEVFRRRSPAEPAAVNLCGSLVGRDTDEAQQEALIDRLHHEPGLLRPRRAAL